MNRNISIEMDGVEEESKHIANLIPSSSPSPANCLHHLSAGISSLFSLRIQSHSNSRVSLTSSHYPSFLPNKNGPKSCRFMCVQEHLNWFSIMIIRSSLSHRHVFREFCAFSNAPCTLFANNKNMIKARKCLHRIRRWGHLQAIKWTQHNW